MVIHVGALQELINLIPGGVRGSLGQRHGAGNVPERMVVVRRSGIHVRQPQPVERVNVAGIVVHCRFESGDRVRVILVLQGHEPGTIVKHRSNIFHSLLELFVGCTGRFLKFLQNFQPMVGVAVRPREFGCGVGFVSFVKKRERETQEAKGREVVGIGLQNLLPNVDGLGHVIRLGICAHLP